MYSNPKIKYTEEQKELIISTYLERGSLRGMQRLFGVAPETLMGWIKKVNSRKLIDELLDAHPTDVLELDELWSFVKARRQGLDLDCTLPSYTPSSGLCVWSA